MARNLGRRNSAALQPDEPASRFRQRFAPDTHTRRREEKTGWCRAPFVMTSGLSDFRKSAVGLRDVDTGWEFILKRLAKW